MTALVGNRRDELRNPNTTFALMPILDSLPHAAPIVVPIVATVVLVKWVYDVCEQSALMLQRLMAYIVDFTIIMQVIFGLVVNARLRLSRRLIKLVLNTYNISEEKGTVHKEIKEHVKLAGRFDRDAALAKIIQLVKEYQMKPENMEELQAKRFENNDDEDWGVCEA
ncbi:uncharacterized protein LACBIDRAFT_313403 [Laccaria bicolor S238N-H82]|uniref:Predicted protein n=1 Tax=Laccaria bicolor (strain S238N-H82 / ATCC MYA-4686) TaxID=486041 RepID=B0DY87_LACBS|nr:uncharacterized protein LACBIDRAFT_313403 [Laccaria bicolor S238N-H82]EDR00482.1 predicted protein [Laccaria bicolor S238N-H82]|eukprot:XP_001888874.1 predicted protein [Laccaria bicolor S238N-H82]